MNSEIVEKLMDVLQQEMKIYNDLLKLSKEKTDIIIKNKVTELEKITKAEQTFILELSGLEVVREEMIGEIALPLNVQPAELTITQLIKDLDPCRSKALKGYQDDFMNIIKELKDSNDINSKLVKNSLDFIDFSINLIAETAYTGNVYGHSGQVNEGKKRSLFDKKL